VALESVEKPGNLGAITRTLDAAGADAIIVCDPRTDIYNPNVIRNSVGTIFLKQIAVASNQSLLNWLHEHQIKSYAAALTAKHYYHESALAQASIFIFGTESHGLSNFWLEQADDQIKIPMLGANDSLNVSNSVAIILYEAKRQRNFEH
jgi:TrmH family RNA methyltransferase